MQVFGWSVFVPALPVLLRGSLEHVPGDAGCHGQDVDKGISLVIWALPTAVVPCTEHDVIQC